MKFLNLSPSPRKTKKEIEKIKEWINELTSPFLSSKYDSQIQKENIKIVKGN